jgi:primosomal protein N'
MEKEKDRIVTLLLVIANDSSIPKSTRRFADTCAEAICSKINQDSICAVQTCLCEVLERSYTYKEEIKEANNYLKKILKEKKKTTRLASKENQKEFEEEAKAIVQKFEDEWISRGYGATGLVSDYFLDMGYFSTDPFDECEFLAKNISERSFAAFEKSKIDIEDYLLRYE